MQQLMDLSKKSVCSLEGAVYNYGAVKNWVEKKLLRKETGKIRRNTEKGFLLSMTSAVLNIPMNCSVHWILATVHVDEHIICIYNSNIPSTTTFDDCGYEIFGLGILRCLNDFYAERQDGNLDADLWTCQFPGCARQTNQVDCGVCMLAFIHMLVCGIWSTRSVDSKGWHKSILNCLVRGEILCPQSPTLV
jgi:Ulp1 family protease